MGSSVGAPLPFVPSKEQKELIERTKMEEARSLVVNLQVKSNAHEVLEEIENEIGGKVCRIEAAIKELVDAVDDIQSIEQQFEMQMSLHPNTKWKKPKEKKPSWIKRIWRAIS